MPQDYYKTLGVDRNADAAEIKKAFRKKAQQYHPDKQDGDEAKFKEVNEAYTVLSDAKKKAQYDQFGTTGPAGSGGFGGGFNAQDFTGGFGGFGGGTQGFEFDLGDIFGSAFGGGGAARRPRRGSDISVEIEIDFRDSVFGTEKTIEIMKNSVCGTCDGTGAQNKKTKTCTTCNGNGRVSRVQQTIMGPMQTETVCDSCNGSGQIPETNCDTCNGAGIVGGKESITIRVPAGIESGQQLRLRNRGEALANGQSGDLYIRVYVREHDRFTKRGPHLFMSLPINLTDAVLGAKKKITLLDGSTTIKIPAGTQHGKQLRIKNKGVATSNGTRGDLYVSLEIIVPTKLNRKQRQLFEQIRENEQ